MRIILRLCVVLAIGIPAWTSAFTNTAGATEYQAPPATVAQPTATPAASTMPSAGAYQTVTPQPAVTNMSPMPTMMSPGTYTVGTQPVTTYATPMPNTAYFTNPYPGRMGGGMMPMGSPAYSYPSMPATTAYGTPAATYTVMPGDTTYQPVRRRFGLFQRWRQQAMPTYGAPTYGNAAYGAPVYSTPGYSAPVYTSYNYGTPTEYTTYASPTVLQPAVGMNAPGVLTGSVTPVYTPTMLSVPAGTAMPGAAPAGTTEPPLSGAIPASNTPTASPAAGQGSAVTPATATPAPPLIPRSNPG